MDIKKSLPAIITAGAALLALILALFLPGAAASESGITMSVGLFGMMIGAAEYKMTGGGETAKVEIEGGMSIFGLISLILLVVGIALLVVSMFKEGKFQFIGSILVAVAGVCVLLLLVAGTKIDSGIGEVAFKEFYDGVNLGIGAILYAVLAILGGGFGILNNYKKIL